MGRKAKTVAAPSGPVQLESLMGIPDVMKVLGLSRPMVYKLIHEEGLPTVTFGDRRKVVPSLLAAWVMQRSQSST